MSRATQRKRWESQRAQRIAGGANPRSEKPTKRGAQKGAFGRVRNSVVSQ